MKIDSTRLIDLTKRHIATMEQRNVLVSVYANAGGFLWQMMKVDTGTDLGYSEYTGDCPESGTFTSYENALEDALDLIELCDLESFKKNVAPEVCHLGNYAEYLIGLRASGAVRKLIEEPKRYFWFACTTTILSRQTKCNLYIVSKKFPTLKEIEDFAKVQVPYHNTELTILIDNWKVMTKEDYYAHLSGNETTEA